MIRSFARRALPVVGAAFVGLPVVQVFLAGLGVFDDPAAFITHREFGYLFGWFTLASSSSRSWAASGGASSA